MGEVSERGGYSRVVHDELAVVIAQPQEGLEFLEVLGGGPVLDNFYLLGVSGDAVGGYDVSKVFYGFLEEFTFRYLTV